jgi:hypothetical protein
MRFARWWPVGVHDTFPKFWLEGCTKLLSTAPTPQVLQRGVRGHRQRASSCVIVASADFTTGIGERPHGHRATVHRGGIDTVTSKVERSETQSDFVLFP